MGWLLETMLNAGYTREDYDEFCDMCKDMSNDVAREGYPDDALCSHADIFEKLLEWAINSGISDIAEHYAEQFDKYIYGWSERWEQEHGYGVWYDESVHRWREITTGRFHVSPYCRP